MPTARVSLSFGWLNPWAGAMEAALPSPIHANAAAWLPPRLGPNMHSCLLAAGCGAAACGRWGRAQSCCPAGGIRCTWRLAPAGVRSARCAPALQCPEADSLHSHCCVLSVSGPLLYQQFPKGTRHSLPAPRRSQPQTCWHWQLRAVQHPCGPGSQASRCLMPPLCRRLCRPLPCTTSWPCFRCVSD